MYSLENLYERIEELLLEHYQKQNPLSVFLKDVHIDSKGLTEEISIKQNMTQEFKKSNLNSKDDFMKATMTLAKQQAGTLTFYENERFLMRLKKLSSTKIINHLSAFKKIQPSDDLLLICNEKTKTKLLDLKINLKSKTFEGIPTNFVIIASIKEFLSKCSIDSLDSSENLKRKLRMECLEFKNNRDDYGPYIYNLEERRELKEKEIQTFISEHYKLNLSYDFIIRFPKEVSCLVCEI